MSVVFLLLLVTPLTGSCDCVTGQSLEQLNTDFRNIRQKFNSRYIRLYGFCDNEGY